MKTFLCVTRTGGSRDRPTFSVSAYFYDIATSMRIQSLMPRHKRRWCHPSLGRFRELEREFPELPF